MDQGTSDDDALLLAAGELVRVAILGAGEVDDAQDVRHDLLDAVAGSAGDLKREGDVLSHRLARQELEVLEDDADLAPQERDVVRTDAADLPAADLNRAGGRFLLGDQHLDRVCAYINDCAT